MSGDVELVGASGIDAEGKMPDTGSVISKALEDRLKAVKADIEKNMGVNFASVEGEVFRFSAFEGFRLEVEPSTGDARIALIYRPHSPGELGTLIQNLHRLSTAPAEREREKRAAHFHPETVGRLSSAEPNLAPDDRAFPYPSEGRDGESGPETA